MTAQLPEPVKLERPDVDWERHKGTGAPKVLPPPGVAWRSASGKTKQRHRYYTRVTTYADAISDQYNLGKWRMRRIALGMGQRPDYVRLASSLTDRDDDRDALDEQIAQHPPLGDRVTDPAGQYPEVVGERSARVVGDVLDECRAGVPDQRLALPDAEHEAGP